MAARYWIPIALIPVTVAACGSSDSRRKPGADADAAAGGASTGGTTAAADVSSLNLARVLRDGDQVTVAETRPTAAAGEGGTGEAAGQLLNLNTATVAQLETLPGIGPALAQRIVDYRTANGPFATLDDLLNVSGIGPSKVDAIRDLVIVQ